MLTPSHKLVTITAAAVILLSLVACSQRDLTPVTPTPTETTVLPPQATPTRAVPTPTAPPTHQPIPLVNRIKISPRSETEFRALAGLDMHLLLSGFAPLEQFTVRYTGPNGQTDIVGPALADTSGEADWLKPTLSDKLGTWTVTVTGTDGGTATAFWQLEQLNLAAPEVSSLETDFRLYHTPEARFHFDQSLHPSWITLIAQYLAQSDDLIEEILGTEVHTVDVFLLPNNAALQREIVKAGSTESSGFEAGIALLGGARPGIYLDMAAPAYSWHHVIAHEFVHHVIGTLEHQQKAPLWLVEGVAEYLGNQVALKTSGDLERQWARQTRANGRRGTDSESWIDFRSIGDYEPWNSERDLENLEQMYGQSFAAAEYIAINYGEAAIGPLLRALIVQPYEIPVSKMCPENLDMPFQQILGISLDEFQKSVREFLSTPTPFERKVDAVLAYSRSVFEISARNWDTESDWRAFLARRPDMSSLERISTLDDFRTRYEILKKDAQEADAPENLFEIAQVLSSVFPLYIEAMQAFVQLERERDPEMLESGNSKLNEAIRRATAAEALLISELSNLGLGEIDVFGKSGANPKNDP